MLSYNEALELLKSKCSENVVNHCLAVSKKSYEIAKIIQKNGHTINADLCRIGGLLHDLGRSVTHDLRHGVAGSELLKNYPELSLIAKTHVGAGIPKDEAKILGLGDNDLIPVTLEEKVVCYADKLVHGDRVVDDASEEIEKLKSKLGSNHPSIERLRRLECEINKLIKKA